MTGKKEIDCVFKSYLEPTKGALFQNGLRGLGALGGKSWTYTIISSHYAWCYSCCHVGYYKGNCQLASLRAKTKLLCLQEYQACSSLPPPPPTLPKTLAPPWDTHTFGRDVGKRGGRNHLGDTSHFSQLGDNQTPSLSYQTAGTSCETFNWSPRQCPLLFCSGSAFAMSRFQSRHTLELIPKQTVLSSHAGFLSDRCLWQKGRWKPSGCCICPPRKSTGPRAKVSRPQNQGRHSYHQFKISNPSINTTSSSEGQLWQVSDLTVLLALLACLPSSCQGWGRCWLSKTLSGDI